MAMSRRSTNEMLAAGCRVRLRAAEEARDAAREEAKRVVQMLARDGFTEAELARLLGVARDTIREWVGKPRKARAGSVRAVDERTEATG